MKPLIVLFAATLVALLIFRLSTGNFNYVLSARIGISVMLLFTAMGHFLFPDGMAMMIPDFIPFKKEWVYITALIEIAAALGLQIPQFRVLTAWLLLLFFILILPANIKAAMEHLNFQKADFSGAGLKYLWFRIPFQLFLIAWVYLSSLKVWD